MVLKKLLAASGISGETARFLIAGGINTGVTYLIYLVAYWIGGSPLWAFNIAFVCGILLSYALHLKVTFRASHTHRKLVKYPLAYLVQYILGVGFLELWLWLGIPAEIAGLLTVPILVPVTFVMTRYILR